MNDFAKYFQAKRDRTGAHLPVYTRDGHFAEPTVSSRLKEVPPTPRSRSSSPWKPAGAGAEKHEPESPRHSARSPRYGAFNPVH